MAWSKWYWTLSFNIVSAMIFVALIPTTLVVGVNDNRLLIPMLFLIFFTAPTNLLLLKPVIWFITGKRFFKPCDYIEEKYSFFGKGDFLFFVKVPTGSVMRVKKEKWEIDLNKKGLLMIKKEGENYKWFLNGIYQNEFKANSEEEYKLIHNLNVWESTKLKIIDNWFYTLHVVQLEEIIERLKWGYLSTKRTKFIMIAGDNLMKEVIFVVTGVAGVVSLPLSFYLDNKKNKTVLWVLLPIGLIGALYLIYAIYLSCSEDSEEKKQSESDLKDIFTQNAENAGTLLELQNSDSSWVWCNPFGVGKLSDPDSLYTLNRPSLESSLKSVYKVKKDTILNEIQAIALSDPPQSREYIFSNERKIIVDFTPTQEDKYKVKFSTRSRNSELKVEAEFEKSFNDDFKSRYENFDKLMNLIKTPEFTTFVDFANDIGNYHALNMSKIIAEAIKVFDGEFKQNVCKYSEQIKDTKCSVGEISLTVSDEEFLIYKRLKNLFQKDFLNELFSHNYMFFERGKIEFEVLNSCVFSAIPVREKNQSKINNTTFKRYVSDLKILYGKGNLGKVLKQSTCFKTLSSSAIKARDNPEEFNIVREEPEDYVRPDDLVLERIRNCTEIPELTVNEEMEVLVNHDKPNKICDFFKGEEGKHEGMKKKLNELFLEGEYMEFLMKNSDLVKGINIMNDGLGKIKFLTFGFKGYGEDPKKTEKFEKIKEGYYKLKNILDGDKEFFDYVSEYAGYKERPNKYLLIIDYITWGKLKNIEKNNLLIKLSLGKMVKKKYDKAEKGNESQQEWNNLVNLLTTTETNKFLTKHVSYHLPEAVENTLNYINQFKNKERQKQRRGRGKQALKGSKLNQNKELCFNKIFSTKEMRGGSGFFELIADKSFKKAKDKISKGVKDQIGKRTKERLNHFMSIIELKVYGLNLSRIKKNKNKNEAKKRGSKKKKGQNEYEMYDCWD